MQHDLKIEIHGGGLAGLLLLAAARFHLPSARINLLEQKNALSTHHTWSFHGSDVPHTAWPWLRPLVTHSWADHEIAFPTFTRHIPSSYHSIRANDLSSYMRHNFSEQISLGQAGVYGPGVVQAIGWGPPSESAEQGFQKFFGLNIRSRDPHGIVRPMLMDARVPQTDGYRFFYLLPWSEHELLVEDTYYANGPALEILQLRAGIAEYIASLGIGEYEVMSEERGALPLPYHAPSAISRPVIGAASGVFHPVTGYTVPHTLRQIEDIFAKPLHSFSDFAAALARSQESARADLGFFYFLNRMLFRSAKPETRYKVLERFYRLSPKLIENFYAGKLTLGQKARLLAGKPPVPIQRAFLEIFR